MESRPVVALRCATQLIQRTLPMSNPSATSSRMSAPELRATVSLAAIFALRMLGLFMIMPVFSIYAKTIPGGENVLLVGIALARTA